MSISAFGLNCTLKASPAESSTQKMLDLILEAIASHGARTSQARVADHNVRPGVSADEGNGDEWPALRKQVMKAQILVIASPIWMGQPSSVAKRVLERLDAVLGEIGDDGVYPTFGKVAVVGVVGNEDGAHHVIAETYQALADVGFTVPAAGGTYWVGEAMGSTDFKDLDQVPDRISDSINTLASNAVHLARALHSSPYPAPKG